MQIREHANKSDTIRLAGAGSEGRDHGVGCVGKLICIYPCVPHNSSWQIQTGPVKGQKGRNSFVRPLITLFQLLCYNLSLLS